MVDRILIGKHDGKQVFRISKPGYDVKNPANPMIVSSEHEYLSVHHRFNNVSFRRQSFSSADVKIYEYYTYLEFPELPYIPYIQITRSVEAHTFPIRWPYASDADYFDGQVGCVATNKGIWMSHIQHVWGADSPYPPFVDVVVYKNRV